MMAEAKGASKEDLNRLELHAIGRVVNSQSRYVITFSEIKDGKVFTRVLTNRFPVSDIDQVKKDIATNLDLIKSKDDKAGF